MKKIINKSILALCLLASCGNKNDNKAAENVTAAPVTTIVGIGKVLPEDGIVMLSVTQPSKVVTIHKKLGDDVEKGDILFELDAAKEDIKVDQSKATAAAAQADYKAAQQQVQIERIKLESLRKIYETSSNLFKANAETKEKLDQDSIAYYQQKALVREKELALQAQKTSLSEKDLAIKASKIDVQDKYYRALQAGSLIRFDVTLGEILTANNTFGELAPHKPLVIEGELDEFYADKIQIGQQVQISLTGQSETIAMGTIKYVGSSLQNKSIIYETVGEGQDRRVRRFTVQITSGQEHLLINQKVECKILL